MATQSELDGNPEVVRAPVVYVVFNRPRHTEQTFAVLREQRPQKLLIIADGPRPGNPGDVALCSEVRAIVERIDWPCDVQRNYAESNLGVKRRVSSGLDWAFEKVDRAIVLEDDCLPCADFFGFCDELLERYADDERVWVITGSNFQDGHCRDDGAYFFSKYNHCWGWATWRRAWKHYRGDLPFWPAWKVSEDWRRTSQNPAERRYWAQIFNRVWAGQIDSWNYPWTACIWYNHALTATPNVNLVTNIGFGPDATHTKYKEDLPGLPLGSLGPLTHPARIEQDEQADSYVFANTYGGKRMGLRGFPRRMLAKLHRTLLAYT